jgi:ubiquinone/menaquinone biosynthesis C-methylase UbiE
MAIAKLRYLLIRPPRNLRKPMPLQIPFQRRGSYGIDAPYALITLTVLSTLFLTYAIVNAFLTGKMGQLLPAVIIVLCVATALHTSRRGKFIVWAKLINQLGLRGDERILDMGCGRGAVLLMAAQHLTTGRAVGVDLWSRIDQSGNSAEATRRNAQAEGVADRIELRTGDMRALPFEDCSLDIVVSSLAIHNIPGRAGREKAVLEAVRVLKPGGRLLFADVKGTRHHEKQLRGMGMSEVTRRRLGWRFWWGGPWAATRLVSATKPETPQ